MAGPPRLLWITPNLPRRGVSAARERFWNLLARLTARHAITLVAFAQPDEANVPDDALPPGLTAIHRVPLRAFTPRDPCALLPQTVAGAFADPALRAAIAARLDAATFDLVQVEFQEMMHLLPDRSLPTLLTVHQLSFAQQYPRWRAEGARVGRAGVFLHRYLRDLDFELRAAAAADHVLTMSSDDARRLRRFLPDLPISVSPVGVDCDAYRPMPADPRHASDLLFVGHFGHPPNLDAVRWFADAIAPRLGGVRLRIVGHAIPDEVHALTRRAPLDVLGPVPDVRPWLAGARAVVAPVRFGTGMRGKVLEALAMGRPVVTTRVGAEGIDGQPGRDFLIADDAGRFADAVRRLLGAPDEAATIGAAGRALIERRYSWDRIAADHERLYDGLLRAPAPGPYRRRWPFAIPTEPRLQGWPAVAAGGIRLLARGAAWHARVLPARRPAPVPALLAP